MELPVKDMKGEQAGTLEVADSLFNVPMNTAVVHQALTMYQANRRQGTHDTKTRGEVSGGGRKPWRQKYTGRARQGSIRAPHWRHGGIVFGPHPRDYRLRMPLAMRRLALRCVLSEKARENKLVVVDKLELSEGRVKEMLQALKALGVNGSALVVTREKDEAVVRSARNLPRLFTLPVDLLNAGALLEKETVLMTVEAVKRAEELWARKPAGAGAAKEEA